jgi:DNA processing protein
MDDDLKYWLALKFVDGVGNIGFKNLIEAFGSPKNVFDATTVDALKRIPGIGWKTALKIKQFKDWQRVDREIELTDRSGVSILTANSLLYPKNLLNIYDFPPLLYVKGTLIEEDINVAVVGSRMAGTYGKFTAERLSRELVLHGITIVSGMARGIDSAAHRGALAGKGRTIAVLGSGIDIVYPPENKKLSERISDNGAVITEFPFTTPPNGPNFPARNRIISGLSLGVVIVEAGNKSGSLITARLALEQGREVFAVPGSIDSPGSRGGHKLIRQGAKLIENINDILEEILPQVDNMPGTRDQGKILPAPPLQKGEREGFPSDLDDTQSAVLNLISNKQMGVEAIIAETGFKAGDVLSALLTLEMQGHIEQLPGKIFKKGSRGQRS